MPEKILSHQFDNGLVLLAEPNESLESAAFTFLIPAGFAREPSDRNGLSGFCCEMVQRGSGEFDSHEIILQLDRLGIERGESVGASHISFSGATLRSNLTKALSLYAGMFRQPHLPADQIEAGRMVIAHEIDAIEDDPAQKLMIELRRRHYPDPWGRPSTGNMEAVENITIEEIQAHVATHFQPTGTILGVAGNVDWEQLKDHVGTILADWPSQPVAKIDVKSRGARREHLKHESNQTQIGIGYDSLPYRDERYFQAWGAVGALSGGMSSRLFTEVREKRGLCYSVFASHHTLLDRGSVFCYSGTSEDRAQETLDVLMAELIRLRDGIEEQELVRLKARVKSGLIMQQESSSARSSSIARDWYLLGKVRTLEEVGAKIDALTSKSINGYLADHPPGDFTIVTLGRRPLEVPVGIS